MGDPVHRSVTKLLVAWRAGSDGALDELIERVYFDLKRIARGRLRGDGAQASLSPTGLVHEAYVRLAEHAEIDWTNRSHFFAVASNVMRRVLVEHARARLRKKREGIRVPLSDATAKTPAVDVDVLDLDAALGKLKDHGYVREAAVVELRYFGGLSVDEAAEHLGVSRVTVKRAWAFAKTWLYRELLVA
ncbi:MAG: ECF-type sigma factor [Acidobacteriota bacterium]